MCLLIVDCKVIRDGNMVMHPRLNILSSSPLTLDASVTFASSVLLTSYERHHTTHG